MSFGGHVADMVNRMKQNRAQRPSNRWKFKENNRDLIYSNLDNNQNRLNFKSVSEKELIKIKRRIRESAKMDRKKMRIFYKTFILIGLITIITVLFWMN